MSLTIGPHQTSSCSFGSTTTPSSSSFSSCAHPASTNNTTSNINVNVASCELMISDESKKHNHSEIEKRRRDKMNHYITELSCLIPMCNAMSRKLDKLTVLRMAVQHMKTIKGSMNAFSGSGKMRPTFLSDEALLKLISQISEGFLFVVSCDRGRILFVSGSVSQILNYSQGDLLGQNWFDILHPKDVAKVKEQLSSSDLSPKERLIDAKRNEGYQQFIWDHQWMELATSTNQSTQLEAMLPVKSSSSPSSQVSMSPGARRSFFCRMKFKSMPRVKEEADTTTGYAQKRRKSQSSDRKYCVVHCIGYLKSWISTKMSVTEEMENESDIYNMSCLVAIGRTLPNLCGPTPYRPHITIKPMSFTSRHTIDGKFLFVDQRATLILGYLPQELLGTCCYEYCHHEDLKILAESHRLGLEASGEYSKSSRYRFKTKSGPYICLQTTWKTFKNPWTKEFEFLIAVNTCVSDIDVVESSVNGESNKSNINSNNNGNFGNWKTSSTVDEILFRISDSCRNKANKSNGSNTNGINGTSNGANNGSGGGGASSNEQSSTGYSSTDTRSVQKMLASSRVALWKIGRYIADEVIENQRRNEESNLLSTSSAYSPIPMSETSFNTNPDSVYPGCDRTRKWRSDNLPRAPGLIVSQVKQLPLINLPEQLLNNNLQSNASINSDNNNNNTNGNNNVATNKNIVTNGGGANNNDSHSSTNTNNINTGGNDNNNTIWMDTGHSSTAGHLNNLHMTGSSNTNNHGSNASGSVDNCSVNMEANSSDYVNTTNGDQLLDNTKRTYRPENSYDPLVRGTNNNSKSGSSSIAGGDDGGGGSSAGGGSGGNNDSSNGNENDLECSETSAKRIRSNNNNCLTSLTCLNGNNYYRTSEVLSVLPTLPESVNESDDSVKMHEPIQINPAHVIADDQENEDVAMDLIMSILEADAGSGGSGDPTHTPCPWF